MRLWPLVIASLLATGAHAQALRELCADRPGLGIPPCIVDKGHLQVEVGLGNWTLDKQPDSRTDTIEAGDLLLRFGVTPSTELRFAWTGYGHVRERDRASGTIDRMSGTGDVTLGLLQNLRNPDGDGFSIGLLPQVTLPSGGKAIGAGTWGTTLFVPVSVDLGDTFQLTATPEVDAAPNESGHGRHLAFGSVLGIVTKLGERIDMTTEVQAIRDREPGQHTTQTFAAISFDYKPARLLQLDVQAVAGLNHDSPDLSLSFGISRKF